MDGSDDEGSSSDEDEDVDIKMEESSDPITKTITIAANRGLVRGGRIPVAMVPNDEPINIPNVAGPVDQMDIENTPLNEVVLVTPEGNVVPVTGEPDLRTVASKGSKKSAPISFDEDWLNNVLAASHPLVRYDNRHPENIEGSVQQQRAGIDNVQRDEIRRTFGDEVPVTTASEMLRRSQGEFGISNRLRQLSNGLIVNRDDNVYNPLNQRSLDIINEATARINMRLETEGQRDTLFERYLNDEQGYMDFLATNFSTFSEEMRNQHSDSIANLRKEMETMDKLYGSMDLGDNAAEQNDRYEDMKKSIEDRIARLQDQLEYDDNKTKLKMAAVEAFQRYKKRKMNAEVSQQEVENASIDQLYEFLGRINQSQIDLMRSIVNAESHLSPERAQQLEAARRELYQTEFVRRKCDTIVTFLSNMARTIPNGEQSTALMNDVRDTVLRIVNRYSGMIDFNANKMTREVTSELCDVFMKHSNNNDLLKQRYVNLIQAISTFEQCYQYLEEILEGDDMSEEEIKQNIGKFLSSLDNLPGGQNVTRALGRDYLRNALKLKVRDGDKIKERLLYLSRKLEAISEAEFKHYTEIMNARRNGDEVSVGNDDVDEGAVDEEERERQRLTNELDTANKKIEEMKKKLHFEQEYIKLENLCNEMISEVSAINLLSTKQNVQEYNNTAFKATQALRLLRSIKAYIENGQQVEGAATTEGLQGLIDQLKEKLATITTERDALEQSRENLWDENTSLTQSLVQEQNNSQQLGLENEELKRNLAKAEELVRIAQGDVQKEQTTNANLKERLDKALEDLDYLINEYAIYRDEAQKTKAALETAVGVLNKAEKENSEAFAREQIKDSAIQQATQTINELTEENRELLADNTRTSRNLQILINRNMDLLNATARTFTESALGYYNSAGGNTMRTNPALINYDSLRFYLNPNQALDILAAQFRRSNMHDPTTDLSLYLLAKRYSEALRRKGAGLDNSEEVSLFVKLASSVLTPDEGGPMGIIDLMKNVGVRNALDYMPDGYWQMFETAVQMNPEVMNNFRTMSSLAMIVDIVNSPYSFIDGKGNDGRLEQLVGNVLNSGSAAGNGIRIIADGIAMRIAKTRLDSQRRLAGRVIPENPMVDDGQTEEDILAERNAEDYQRAMDIFKKAREMIYLDIARAWSGSIMNLNEVYSSAVNQTILQRYVFSDEGYRSIYSRLYNNMAGTMENYNPQLHEAVRIYLGQDDDTVTNLFENRFIGRDSDAFNNVYLGFIQTYIERYNTASTTERNVLSNELQAPRVASRGIIVPVQPEEEQQPTRRLPTHDPELD